MSVQISRRGLLGGIAALSGMAAVEPASAALRLPMARPSGLVTSSPKSAPEADLLAAAGDARTLRLFNLHTGEHAKITYWAEGKYEPEAMAEIDHILRDHRAHEAYRMAPDLLDLMYAMQLKLDTSEELNIISGYRSPQTNAALRANSKGVAKRSYHMKGMAVDIRVPNRNVGKVYDAAMDLRVGGVGYYPRSDFVHIDVGPVRRWGAARRA